MSKVRMSDVTLKQSSARSLSFKEKTELVKLLDQLKADSIELPRIESKGDSLFVKTAADAVNSSAVSVETICGKEAVDTAWDALKDAAHPRIQITAPVSLVQMEYLDHKRPQAVLQEVCDTVAYAASLTDDIEFRAEDATRSERDFLYEILEAAIKAGAGTVTVCDAAGTILPDEFAAFIRDVKEHVPSLADACLGFSCSNNMNLADACAVAGMTAGAGEVKVSIYPDDSISLETAANIIHRRGSEYDLSMGVRTVELRRLKEKAAQMFTTSRSKTSPFDTGVRDAGSGRTFTMSDDIRTITKETVALGYDLSEEDQVRVYEEFIRIAEKKDHVSVREIEAIIASNAMQVPPTYRVADYIVNCCSMISATAQIRLWKNNEILESVALGDGPVDASFLAIEQIAGRHYELDDFQIRAVTEGREAMGEAIVKLRCEGRVYSGRGLSTDIIGSAISAYINAMNKIVYEEETE